MSNTTETANWKSFSPYQCAGVINKELAARGFDIQLPPQMFYTYVNKGYIKSFERNGRKLVLDVDLAKWFEVYLQKKADLAARKAQLASK